VGNQALEARGDDQAALGDQMLQEWTVAFGVASASGREQHNSLRLGRAQPQGIHVRLPRSIRS